MSILYCLQKRRSEDPCCSKSPSAAALLISTPESQKAHQISGTLDGATNSKSTAKRLQILERMEHEREERERQERDQQERVARVWKEKTSFSLGPHITPLPCHTVSF